MVKYRFAITPEDTIADAQSLAGRDVSGSEFHCLGCENVLIPKVNGAVREPHFAHHPGTTCSPETYLHRLGKHVFADVYHECVATGVPFEIELRHSIVCRRFESLVGSPCFSDRCHVKAYDLTMYFNQIRLENRDGEFIPDLLLTSDKNPELRIYIEIAVTHFMTERKKNSGERIIEIPLETEACIEHIKSRKITPGNARFVNFVTESQSLVDSECNCAEVPGYAFIVYDSGKCILDKDTMSGLASKRQKHADKIRYFRFFDLRDRFAEFFVSPGTLFREAVKQAHNDGVQLRNCYLCRYQGDNFAGDPERPIFCKCFKKTCGSNAAVECEAFRLSLP